MRYNHLLLVSLLASSLIPEPSLSNDRESDDMTSGRLKSIQDSASAMQPYQDVPGKGNVFDFVFDPVRSADSFNGKSGRSTKVDPNVGSSSYKSILNLCGNGEITSRSENLKQACYSLLIRIVRLAAEEINERQEFEKFRRLHTKKALKSQAWQGTSIFWIAITVIVIGVIASVAQFVRSLMVDDQDGNAEIVIKNNEFRFKTTWLGALLLGMSMAFLTLYLVFVYPVQYIGS